MRSGIVLSLMFHGALLAFAVLSLATAKTLKPVEIKSIPMDIIDISELTKLKAGLKKAPEKKELKKPEPKPIAKRIEPEKKKKKPKPKRAVQPKAEKPQVEEVKPPEKPEVVKKKVEPLIVKKKVAQKPKPKPKPKVKPKPKPKPKAKIVKKVKKKKFNEDKIAALLNKVPDAGPTTSKLPDLPGAKKVKGDTRGRDVVMSINDIDLFRRQVSRCWNPPVGGLGAEDLLVKVRMRLNKDGTLKNQPKVMNRGSNTFFRAAADSAVRAIWQCQPYNLPDDKYKVWQDMILNFNPQDMLRG